jgi:arabinogalactan endo-1,4-beta-galactosidase
MNAHRCIATAVIIGNFLQAAAMPTTSLAQTATAPSAFLLGADISTLAQMEQHGGIFRDGGQPADAIDIFKRHGWNCFRLRLFVNPNGRGGVINSLEYTCALAQRIKAAGAVLILDLHYSDTWADPQHQVKPAAWKDLEFDALENTVRSYTAAVLRQMKDHGALPDIVQVGNEITGGTLWPDAQVQVPLSTVKVFDATVKPIQPPQPYDDARQWDRLTRILKAGIRGVRDATNPADAVRIMIHIDCGGDWPVTQWYFDRLIAHHVDFDIIGQSYYPYWHGTLDDVRQNLQHTARVYHKDIVIVETAYPWKDSQRWSNRKNMAWPISAKGQRHFMAELIDVVRHAPDGRGIGVIYWHPESVPLPGTQGRVWNGGDMSLFDDRGNALPAMDVLDAAAAKPAATAPDPAAQLK